MEARRRNNKIIRISKKLNSVGLPLSSRNGRFLLYSCSSMHGDQIYSFHKPMHIHQGPNSLLWGDVKNWSSSWDAWTLPTHLHLYKFLQLHWPFPEGQFPKVETNHVELQHHHLKTPPCRGLERAVQHNKSARRFWANRWRKQKCKNFGQPQRLD